MRGVKTSHYLISATNKTLLTFLITQREFDATAMTQRRTHLVKTNNGASTYISYIASVQTKFAESAFHCVTFYGDIRRKYYLINEGEEKRAWYPLLAHASHFPVFSNLEPGCKARPWDEAIGLVVELAY